MRLTIVLTHPVQYFSPWFRYISEKRAADIDLTVLYGAIPTEEQQGTGFGTAFSWDTPVTDGYRHVVCRMADGMDFNSDRFFGVDVPDIAEHIAATAPEAVIVPGWHSRMQLRALTACRTLGVPVLYRGDSTLASGPRRLVRPLWRLKTRSMLRRFDRYLSVGTAATQYLRSFGVPEGAIYDSPHCVDNDWFAAEAERHRPGREALRGAAGAGDDDFVVLFAGKFVERKRPLDAVRAVAELGAKAVLVMAGDGPLADDARREAQRLGVRTHWRGFLNQSALPEAFATADAAVVPSAWESWGLIVNEALASGIPCVTTSEVAAARDLIVEGESGHTVEVGDVAAMTARLQSLREAVGRGHDFVQTCRQAVQRCSFAGATDGVVDAMRTTIRTRRGADAD